MAEKSNDTLSLEVSETGPAAVVRISGAADMAAAERLRETLDELTQKQVTLIVLDLSGLEFIGSMGLGAIVYGHLRSRHRRGQIRLVNPQPVVREVLETTRLTQLFSIYESVDQAMAQ